MSGLAWRSHLRPVVIPPDFLILLSENGHRFLKGAAYTKIAPLLDGRWSDDEICAQLEQIGVPAVSGWLALSHLRELGLLRRLNGLGVANRAPQKNAFWEALDEDPAIVRARLEASRVTVQGCTANGSMQLCEALETSGVGIADEESDLSIQVWDDYLDPQLAIVNRTALATNKPWMLTKLCGTVAWIGPLFIPRHTGCWACLAQRMRLNREVEMVIEDRLGPDSRAPQPTSQASLDLFANFAALEIIRWLALGSHYGLEGALLTLDLKTNAMTRHALVRRPQCPACGSDAQPGEARLHDRIVLGASPKREFAGGRSESAAAVMKRFEHHISPLTGVVRALHETVEDGYLHVAAAHSFPSHRYDFAVLRDNLLGRSGGKGFDRTEARVGALCEGLERYSGTWRGEEEVIVRATRRDVVDDSVDVDRLFGFSARQYAERESWNATNDEPHAWMPKPLDETLDIDWVRVPSLSHAAARLVPAAYCYYGHPDLRRAFCSADSNGCAAGGTFTEAVAHGLLELVERDAAAIWWYNRLSRPAVHLDSFELAIVARTRALCAKQGRSFWALWLTTDLGVPVVVAVSARLDDPVEDIIYGFGSDFRPAAAVEKAISEMNQSLFSVLRAGPGGRTRYRNHRPAARRWFRTATRSNQPYLLPDANAALEASQIVSGLEHNEWRDDVAACVAQFGTRGLEVLVLDQTRADIGLPVCRVIIPGLCHFWRRFGLSRLYDVPVRMGWTAQPTPESDLNPWFIYF